MSEEELRKRLKKYSYAELTNMYVSTRIQTLKLKESKEVLEVEKEYWKSEYNKMIKKIKNISKELILVKKELLEKSGNNEVR
jgi:hypothetical protein